MTSASELFSRRCRPVFRNPNLITGDAHLAVDPTLPSDPHRRPPRHRPRPRPLRHGDDCRSSRHRVLEAEHELLQSDSSGPSNSRTGINSNGRTVGNRINQLTLIRRGQRNERLPGTVQQARARLIERLHGISLTENRQNITAPSIFQNEFVADNDFGIMDSGDWESETSREWIEPDIQFTDLAVDTTHAMSLHNVGKKKPPGLSWETICSLPQVIFKGARENDGSMRASGDCCICLERFLEGYRLFQLPCYHRFHPSCLEPWLQNCGDCPYCRASV